MRIITTAFMLTCFIACQAPKNDLASSLEAFKTNAESIKKMMQNYVDETPDYSVYDSTFVFYPTNFYTKNPISIALKEYRVRDKFILDIYDFEIVDALNPIPGFDAETQKIDNSVNVNVTWKITKSATDSTKRRSAMMPIHHAYYFNEEGKIVKYESFGNFTGLFQYLDVKE